MNRPDVSRTGDDGNAVGERRAPSSINSLKAMQSAKIREIRQALVRAGFETLEGQAKCLGLTRSTACAVLKGNHKGSGLSATLIKRMLASPELPPSAKKVILEYAENKCAGAYGHHQHRLRLFRSQLQDSPEPEGPAPTRGN